MPHTKIKIDSTAAQNWNSYLNIHRMDSNYRLLNAKRLQQEFQEAVRSNEKCMQQVYEVYAAISTHYTATVGPTEDRIIELPKYRAIVYEEISKCMTYWDGKRAEWKDPITGIEYKKVGTEYVKVAQYVYENFFEEKFYQYTVKKAIDAGQSLKEKEKILKRQVDRSQRLGKKPPLTKYNIVKKTRKAAEKQGRYITRFLDFYNNPGFALPFAAWTNIFSANPVHYPEETAFRNSIKRLISEYLQGILPEISRFPLLDKKIKEQTDFKKND